LRIIFVLAEERIKDIQLIQRREKPKCSSNWKRYDQLIVLKAFAISIFISAEGLLFLRRSFADSWIARKFS